MTDSEARTCWEYWNCKEEVRKKCSAYTTNSGKECWMLAGSIVVKLKKCPRVQNEYKDCSECPWFKKLNPDFNAGETKN